MNIKALIKKYEELWNEHSPFHEPVPYTSMIELFLKELKQLDEPQPVKVPSFVAVWYEINKENFDENIAYLCLNNWGEFINDKTLFNWMSNTDNFIQILVNMHQFGYEVEEEKRYIVSLKNGQPLLKSQSGNTLYFNQNITAGNYKFTRKELEEAGFGWVLDCEGIEIEEVE